MWRPPCLLQDQSRKAAASFARIAERFMLLRTRGIRTLTAIPQNVWFADTSCPSGIQPTFPPSSSFTDLKMPNDFRFMSALPPKAAAAVADRCVRFGPKTAAPIRRRRRGFTGLTAPSTRTARFNSDKRKP